MEGTVFCEHGTLVLHCPECRPEREEGEDDRLSQLGADWAECWYVWRRECHERIRALIQAVHERGFTDETYYAIYDEPTARGRKPSEAEDPFSANGSFRIAFVKMFDATFSADRIEGYNAQSDWARFLEETAKTSPDELRERIDDGEIKIHGGNGSWSHQQRAGALWEHPALWDIVEIACYGRERRSIAELDDNDMVDRLATAKAFAEEKGTSISLALCSKLALVFDPERWPVYNQRANAEIASHMGLEVPEPRNPEQYVVYAQKLREFANDNGMRDLEWLDMHFSETYNQIRNQE